MEDSPTPARLLRRCACGQHAGGGVCEACRKQRLSRNLQHRGVAAQGPALAPPSVHETLASGGAPLDGAARAHFERGFGRDFSRVRVHSDAGAARSAREVAARAYAVGNHVVFGAGQYRPRSPEGRRLLGHELAHVAQQEGVPSAGEIRVGRTDSPAEREAEGAAGALETGRAPILRRSTPELARVPDAEDTSNQLVELFGFDEEAAEDEGEVQDGDSPVLLSGGGGEANAAAAEAADFPDVSLGVAGLGLPMLALTDDTETESGGGGGKKPKAAPKKPPKGDAKDQHKAPAKKPPPRKITKIEVDLTGQKMTLTWSDGTTEGPVNVSTGKGRPDTKDDPCKAQTEKNCTPVGTFKVGYRGDGKTKNSHGDAMSWYIDLTGDPVISGRGIGIHNSQPVFPGKVASHGCVRVGKGAAADAFAKKINQNVIPGSTEVVITGKTPTKAYESAAGRAKRLAAEKKKKQEVKKKAGGSKTPPSKGGKPPAKKGK